MWPKWRQRTFGAGREAGLMSNPSSAGRQMRSETFHDRLRAMAAGYGAFQVPGAAPAGPVTRGIG